VAIDTFRRIRDLYWLMFRDGTTTGSRTRDVVDKSTYLGRQSKLVWSPARRARGVDELPLVKPIFLLGVEGGGLTVLARVLARHGSMVTAMGNSSYWTPLDEIGTHATRTRRLPPSLRGSKNRYDLEHPVYGVQHACIYACDDLLPLYRRTAVDATPEDAEAFKRLLREHIAVYAENPRRARFLDKTQTYTVKAGYVNALLAGCEPHFVLVVRNPYTMVYRSANKRMQSPQLACLSYARRLSLAAEHWTNSFAAAVEDSSSIERFLTVRFEDFLAQPERALAEICAFADLRYREDMLPQPHHALPRGTWPGDDKWYPLREDAWLPEVRAVEATIVEQHCGTLAARFGYAAVGARP
jgi:hypothetical protein